MNSKENIIQFIGEQSYREAIAEIDKAFITVPNRAYYFYLKGYCFYRLGNYFRAISLCKQAIEGEVEVEDCYLLIGQSYESMEWFQEAENSFLLGLSINPNNSEIKAAYAYLLLKNGYICEAYTLILQAIKSDPENNMVNYYVVYFYLNKESFNFEKYEIIKTFLENSQNEILKYIKAGKVDLEKKRYKAAMDNFEKAYLLDSENESVANVLDELRLKIKFIYKPSLIVDIVGGWNSFAEVLVVITFVNIFAQVMGKNILLNSTISFILILWTLIGVYKLIIDSYYWKFYSWE